jgi:hypothetical protein
MRPLRAARADVHENFHAVLAVQALESVTNQTLERNRFYPAGDRVGATRHLGDDARERVVRERDPADLDFRHQHVHRRNL